MKPLINEKNYGILNLFSLQFIPSLFYCEMDWNQLKLEKAIWNYQIITSFAKQNLYFILKDKYFLNVNKSSIFLIFS